MAEGLSGFEQLILTALLTAEKDTPQYGITIHATVNSLVQNIRPVSRQHIYVTLARLERKKYVRSWNGGITKKRGGRFKRYYAATATGTRALHKSLVVSANMLAAIKLSSPN